MGHRGHLLELHRRKAHVFKQLLDIEPFNPLHRLNVPRGQVQIIFQRLPPGFYWGSEMLYITLSLTAKLYLGFFLLINVLYADGSVEQALEPAQ